MTDFLIVGGGIAGVSAAARLSHLGSIRVVEAEDALGYHASGRSAALFEPHYGSAATVALNRASHAYMREANGGVLSDRGLMLVGTRAEQEAARADMKALAFEPISVDEARAMVPVLNPETVHVTGYRSEAYDIDTDLLLQNFAREARSNGTIHTKARVSAIRRTDAGWLVDTAAGEFEGRILVNAAGAWVDRVAVMAGVRPVGAQPLRRSMAQIPAPGGHDVSRWPMMNGPAEAWYAKPDAGKLIVSPADEDPQEPHDAWADDMVLAEGLARFEAVVTEPVTRLETSWAGLRTFAPDRQMVIGFAPDAPGFFWHACQGGYGFQTAPATSQLAADLVAGRRSELPPDVVAALSPSRFAT